MQADVDPVGNLSCPEAGWTLARGIDWIRGERVEKEPRLAIAECHHEGLSS
jgi:hypothetical protein